MQFKSVIGAVVLAAASIPYFGAHAEEAVVVSATRFPETGAEYPTGVTVITRKQIEQSAASSLPDLLSRYAGINTRNNSGSPDVAIDLRGFGASGNQNTLILLDGQRLNDIELTPVSWSAIPLDAIERVEIQRGGGAVLYGAGATGGTINIVTRSPIAGAKRATLSASRGSYASNGVHAALNLAGDNTGFALNADQHNSDNYRANNRLEQDSVLGDLRWTGDRAGLALKFGLDNQRLRLPGARTNVQLQSDPRGTATPNDYSSRDGANATLAGRYEFDAFSAAADLSYRDTKRNAFFDNYYGAFGQSSFLDTRGQVWAFTPRAKVPYRLFGRDSTLIVGIDLDYWKYRSVRAADAAALGDPLADIGATQRDRAVYLQNQTALGAATRLSLGARLQQVDIAVSDSANARANASAAQARVPRAWEAALRHALDATTTLYGKIGGSFRVANVDEMFNSCGYFDFNTFSCQSTVTPLEPQTAHEREIGVERKLASARLRANYYRIDLRNEIHFNALTFTNMNLSPTQREGLELEGDWTLAPRWSVFASYTRARAIFRTGTYAGVDVSGKNVPLVPRDMAKLGLTWQVQDRTRVGTALSYVGKQYYDNDQANNFAGGQMPSYTTVDLKLEHSARDWDFTLAANNLSDKKYYTYAVRGGGATATNFNAYPMPGRNFLFTAAYRWQ